jgi:hypothetical protein
MLHTLSLQKMQRRRTWWASLFFGASSQEASKDVIAAANHDLLQDDLQQGPLSGDGSALDERFSTNAEEMQRAAGEMDQAEAEGELGHGGGTHNMEQDTAVEEPPEKRCVVASCILLVPTRISIAMYCRVGVAIEL